MDHTERIMLENARRVNNSPSGNPQWVVVVRNLDNGVVTTRRTGRDCSVNFDVENQMNATFRGEGQPLLATIHRGEIVSWTVA